MGPYVPPVEVWLPAQRGKGLEIEGHFVRRGGQMLMEMTFVNKALQYMSDFAIQFNKNSFGLSPAQPLQIQSPLAPAARASGTLILNSMGAVMKMEPLLTLQVSWDRAVLSYMCVRSAFSLRSTSFE